jgi:hypothetical protein
MFMNLFLLLCVLTTIILYLYCENNNIQDENAYSKIAFDFSMFVTTLLIFFYILYSCY